MQANRAVFSQTLFAREGGVSNHPKDPGGLTNHGITQETLSEWLQRPATDDEVRNLSLKDAEEILWLRYWNPIRGNDLVAGIDVYLADFAFNSGVRTAVKKLQALLGFTGSDVDGIIGPLSLQAVAKRKPDELLRDLHSERISFLRRLKTWPTFGKGWTERCEAMLTLALTLVPQDAPALVAHNDGIKRRVATVIASVGTCGSAALPIIIAELPHAKATYGQVTTALAPIQEIAPWAVTAVQLLAVAAVVATLFLAVRSSNMAHNAKLNGSIASVVAAPRMTSEEAPKLAAPMSPPKPAAAT